jgi:hypothetical protein
VPFQYAAFQTGLDGQADRCTLTEQEHEQRVRQLNKIPGDFAGIEYLQPDHKLGETVKLARLILLTVSGGGEMQNIVLEKKEFFWQVWSLYVDTWFYKAETVEWASPWRDAHIR